MTFYRLFNDDEQSQIGDIRIEQAKHIRPINGEIVPPGTIDAVERMLDHPDCSQAKEAVRDLLKKAKEGMP